MKKPIIYPFFVVLTSILVFCTLWFSPKKITTLTLKESTFNQLPGWTTAPVKQSLTAFQSSCKTFLKQNPSHSAGSQHLAFQVSDWQGACKAAMTIRPNSNTAAKTFFETWFAPVEFYKKKPVRGLFTGYFMPELRGNITKTNDYKTPIYGLPSNRITANLGLFNPTLKNKRITGRVQEQRLLPFYTREQISRGALRGKAKVLFWVNSPIDRLFLEIEGSGAVKLDDGKTIYIGYAGENGRPYQSIASILIKQGVLTHDNASSAHIKKYLNAHPSKIDSILNQNQSFVFFRKLPTNAAIGAQGVPLTPGYTLAVDREWIPYGTPVWLNTTKLNEKDKTKQPFNRLMVAQDTGGAIKGIVRGDVFWGDGKKAAVIASHMQEEGRYWLLLPRHAIARLKQDWTLDKKT